jgi:hypothetical protein
VSCGSPVKNGAIDKEAGTDADMIVGSELYSSKSDVNRGGDKTSGAFARRPLFVHSLTLPSPLVAVHSALEHTLYSRSARLTATDGQLQ